jgi:hypothetical protein
MVARAYYRFIWELDMDRHFVVLTTLPYSDIGGLIRMVANNLVVSEVPYASAIAVIL